VTNTLSNCSTPVQVVVTSNTTVPTITITPTQTLTCATPTAAITLTTTPNSGLTYTWTGTLLSGQGTDFITINQAGNYSVVVTNAANGCTNTASTQVDVDANLPTASINISSTNTVITCSNQSVDLTVNVSPLATYNYTWSTASTANNISVTSANVYSVTVVNPSTGCSAVAFYTVTSNTLSPTVQTTNTVIPCNTNTVNVIATSTSAVTYSWTSTNGILLTNGTSSALVGSIGDYAVTVTDINNGCISTTTASVSQTIINASFTANPLSGSAPLLVDFTNTSNNPVGTSYNWNFGDLNNATTINASNTYTLTGNYTVTLTATDAASSCTATSTINIEVLENSYISVPNVFTPNGDNANDVFKIETRGIKDLTCEIFNRWGLKIYTLIATKDSWDGLNESAGTYFYILKAQGYDGKEYKQQGFISLFK
jgi:gliding motility-associated-like protein